MISRDFRSRSMLWMVGSSCLLAFALTVAGQESTQKADKPEHHSRRYRPLEPAVKITVTVEKAANGKPISNAGVIFRATKNGKNEGSLEIKSDPDGRAIIDVIEVGSHVKVQVIADGFSTAAAEFDTPTEVKDITIKMEKPRAQISTYDDGTDRPSARPPGVQEPRPIAKKPAALKPMPSSAPSPLTTPPVATPPTPETTPPSGAPASSKDVSGAGTPSAGASSTAPSTVTPGAATVGAPK